MNESEFELVEGNGTVFRDFGDPDADLKPAESLIAARIIAVLDEAELAVRKAQDMTGFAAADFSRIRDASLARFTLDRPIRILAALDGLIRVTVHIDPRWIGAAATQFPGRRTLRFRTRPALSNERLSVNERGQVVYRLKHPFRDGTTHVVLDPLDFIARLAALVPRPRAHLTRYHGGFAPNFRHRNHIVPHIAHQGAPKPPSPTPPMNWMQRLKRVFHLDIEHCPLCGGTLRVIACIEAPDLIERILAHLAAREADSVHRPRAPPSELAQRAESPSASRAELLASPSLVIS